jgi:3-hydroxyisobutyrate dehydrogenase-like beta-hydroxyacid dehydrogenase
MRISVIGMGSMGRAFAARALETGHAVTVWNRTANRAADLISSGAVEAQSPKDAAAGSDVALILLADDDAVLSVCLGDDGVLSALPAGATLVIVSTVSPETVRRLAGVAPQGAVLDAPVMGSPSAIAAGVGSFLVGGPSASVTRLDALWNDLGAGYQHCGPVGAGATMKIVSNLLLITGVAALAEAVATARHHGIPDEMLQTLFAESFVVSPASKVRLDSLFDEAHPGWFTPALARKDVRLAVSLADEAGVGARIGPATDLLLSTVVDSGRAWPDFSAVIEAFNPR